MVEWWLWRRVGGGYVSGGYVEWEVVSGWWSGWRRVCEWGCEWVVEWLEASVSGWWWSGCEWAVEWLGG